MKSDSSVAASHSETDLQAPGFGDTETPTGLVALLDFIKKQHIKTRLRHEPMAVVRFEKIEKYRLQKNGPVQTTKKGLQLRKAA